MRFSCSLPFSYIFFRWSLRIGRVLFLFLCSFFFIQINNFIGVLTFHLTYYIFVCQKYFPSHKLFILRLLIFGSVTWFCDSYFSVSWWILKWPLQYVSNAHSQSNSFIWLKFHSVEFHFKMLINIFTMQITIDTLQTERAQRSSLIWYQIEDFPMVRKF